MEFKDDEIKRLQLAAEAEEKKRFLHNIGSLENITEEASPENKSTPQAPLDEKSPLKQIRTYQGDVASALEHQNESLVSIQKSEAAKQSALNARKVPRQERSFKPIILTFFIFIFIALGVSGGYWAYLRFKKETAAPIVITPPNRLIPILEERNINTTNLSREQFINLVREETVKNSSPEEKSGIIQLELRKGEGEIAPLLQTSEFFVLMETRAPGALVRALDSIFMLGLSSGTPAHPFILIKLKSFEQAFPGMLEWEDGLREDLLPLFIDSSLLSGISSENKFEDVTIANKDARVLKSNDGKIVLLYAFIDNEALLITDNENSLKTLQNQYSAGKLSR
jgi:hypothetical protein